MIVEFKYLASSAGASCIFSSGRRPMVSSNGASTSAMSETEQAGILGTKPAAHHALEAPEDEIDALLEGNEEVGHFGVGDGELS